jgi:hypothetical protein
MREFDAYRCESSVAHRRRQCFDRLLHRLLLLGHRLAVCTFITWIENVPRRTPVGVSLFPPDRRAGFSH